MIVLFQTLLASLTGSLNQSCGPSIIGKIIVKTATYGDTVANRNTVADKETVTGSDTVSSRDTVSLGGMVLHGGMWVVLEESKNCKAG